MFSFLPEERGRSPYIIFWPGLLIRFILYKLGVNLLSSGKKNNFDIVTLNTAAA
jgi:hypothetical protein